MRRARCSVVRRSQAQKAAVHLKLLDVLHHLQRIHEKEKKRHESTPSVSKT
jgi:hypothetical protein